MCVCVCVCVAHRGSDELPVAKRRSAGAAVGGDGAHGAAASSEAQSAAGRSGDGGELAALQRENVALREQLRSDVDAARDIERSVAQVGVLQRTFAANVAEQADALAHVQTQLAGATDAVSRGNEQLAQAAARAVDFRIFVLLFMLVSSFALLFVDWYS